MKPRRKPHPVIVRLRHLRHLRGLSTRQLGEELGYHASTITHWERGTQVPFYRSLLDWCDVLNCDLVVRDRG